jgi:hypothetical protein
MTIGQVLATAQGGSLFQKLAGISGLSESDCRAAMAGIAPAIAARVKETAHDPERFTELLDRLEDNQGDLLADGDLESLDTEEDGNAVLASAYGSPAAAREEAARTARALRLDEAAVHRLMTIAAALVLAILAKRNNELAQSSAERAAAADDRETTQPGGAPGARGGILSVFLAALGAGIARAIANRFLPRRRRRYGYQRPAYRRSRRYSQPSRRRRQPTLDEIFRGFIN